MEVIFRNYQPADFDALAQMVQGLYSKDGHSPTEMTIEKVALSAEKLCEEKSAGLIFLFEKASEAIGYSIVNRFWSNEFSGYILYIDELFVKPAFRNEGIGAQFLEYLQSNPGNDCVAFMLETVRTNEKAIRFYEKNGFGTHHNHLMFKRLA